MSYICWYNKVGVKIMGGSIALKSDAPTMRWSFILYY